MTHRLAFQLGPIAIYWYGIFVALGFLAGLYVMRWRARRTGFPEARIPDLVLAAMVGGVIGARFFYVVSYWDQFRDNLAEIFMVWHGGVVFYGGFFGATAVMIWFCRKFKLDAWHVADLVAFGLPLGQAFGRIGCFINGCCFGKVSHAPWAVTYYAPPHETVLQTQIDQGLITNDLIPSLLHNGVHSCLPVTPVQAFQSLTNVAIFGLVWFLSPRFKGRGQLFGLYLLLYGIGRFLNEFNRGDYLVRHAGFTIAQVICFIIVPAGVFLLWYRRPRPKAS